jgi:hypothetical protein
MAKRTHNLSSAATSRTSTHLYCSFPRPNRTKNSDKFDHVDHDSLGDFSDTVTDVFFGEMKMDFETSR